MGRLGRHFLAAYLGGSSAQIVLIEQLGQRLQSIGELLDRGV